MLKDDVIPTQLPARNVPEALRQPLKEELGCMEKMGVITKVEKATDWCDSLVYVVKSDKSMKMCLDPRNLNHWTKSPKYFCALNKDILLTLSKGRYFSTLDCKSGYLAGLLEELSSYLTRFNTPFSRYRFLRQCHV